MAKNKAKISVLVATGLYPPDIGGPATYSKMLHDKLPAYDVDVVVLSFGSVRMFPIGIRHLIYFVRLLIKSFKADVIFALDPVSVGFPALLVSNATGKKFFLRFGGDYAWEIASLKNIVSTPPHEFKKETNIPFSIKLLARIQRLVADQSDKIIVPSNYLKKVVASWGISKSQIVVIPNAVEDLSHVASKGVLRKMMSIDGESKIIFSAGRLIPLKSLDKIIDVVPEIDKLRKGTKYIIAGDGPQKSALEKQVKELNLEDKVVFVGSLDHDTLLRYIKVADVFVLNSLHETFPNIVLEAMALGTPVVATKVGGNVEILEQNKNGKLISYGNRDDAINAISTLLLGGREASSLKSQALKDVEKYRISKILPLTANELKK